MTVARMPRLEAVFGARVDELSWERLLGVVSSAASESQDLEFKGQHYGNSDSDKREFAKDIASLANASGGVLLIGIVESDGRAAGIQEVSLLESDIVRYRQIAANFVAPLPSFELMAVPSPDSSDVGVLAIVVERSSSSPHGQLVNEGFRFPRRHGTTTIWLSEPELADAYLRRFTLHDAAGVRSEKLAEEFVRTLDITEPWLILMLVPDSLGYMPIDKSVYQAFQARMQSRNAGLPWSGVSYQRFGVGPRRLRADGGPSRGAGESGPAQWCAMELHADGSGAYAIRIADLARTEREIDGVRRPVILDDEDIAAGLISGLAWLGEHAWQAGAGGVVTLRASVVPVDAGQQAVLGQGRSWAGGDTYGYPVDFAESVTVNALATDLHPIGPDLIGTAALLLSDVAQAFGVAELGQLDREGRVRLLYWRSGIQQHVRAWCEAHSIEATQETI